MSPIGKLLVENCYNDNDRLLINMNQFWTLFYKLGFHKKQVEAYARQIGIEPVHLPISPQMKLSVSETIPDSVRAHQTIIGIPLPKISR